MLPVRLYSVSICAGAPHRLECHCHVPQDLALQASKLSEVASGDGTLGPLQEQHVLFLTAELSLQCSSSHLLKHGLM